MAAQKTVTVKNPHIGGMGSWKRRIIQKRSRGSQTPGRMKNHTCQADYLKKYYAKVSRSYKDPGYSAWCKAMDAANTGVRK